MLKLSQSIIREVFKVLRELNIDVIRLKHKDLDNIVALLGAQQDYADLEVCPSKPFLPSSNHPHTYLACPLQYLLKRL